MTYQEQRNKVIDLQTQIARINHQLENPSIRGVECAVLMKKRDTIYEDWKKEITIMRSMAEYNGPFKV